MDKLLRLLSENSDYSPAELALMLDETEENIIDRIRSYEKQGIIKGHRAIVDFENVEDSGVTAYIELKVTPLKEKGFDEVAEKIMGFDEVASVYLMAGTYDLALIVKGDTIQDVSSFVSRKLSALDGILSTATHFILKRYKDDGVILTDIPDDERRCMQF
ncbi:MAG: Lrp/AsnC family transcriptional regulator [Oscillospiraceae bacterium]|nr:Lrp/AsnC family transcriptional regulator [Oscillospiraceae bacterium]